MLILAKSNPNEADLIWTRKLNLPVFVLLLAEVHDPHI